MQSHAQSLVLIATALSSATQFRCCDCERDFINEEALASHLRSSKVHKPRKGDNNKKRKQSKGDQQTKCTKCERTFKSDTAQKQHLASVRHKPLSDIKCIADVKCRKQFNCPSAQLYHLESGKCVSGMTKTKTKLNAEIAANDTGRIITSGGVTAAWLLENSSAASSQSPILTPTSTEFLDSYPPSAILTPTSTLSTSTNFYSSLTLRLRVRGGFKPAPSVLRSVLAPSRLAHFGNICCRAPTPKFLRHPCPYPC